MQSIGFIGLGIMGRAMAKNLITAGFAVTVWNRSPEKAAELTALGAGLAETPQAVVEGSAITFAMLADPAAAANCGEYRNARKPHDGACHGGGRDAALEHGA